MYPRHLWLIFLVLICSCHSAKKSLQIGSPVPPPTILLIATSHDLRETPAEAVEEVKKAILQFQPDVFFVELPPADDKYANELVFKYSHNFPLFHHLLNKKNIEIRLADSVIAENQRILEKEPDNPLCIGSLLHANLLKFDIANTLYQSYQLFSQYDRNDSVMALIDSTLFSVDTLDQNQLIVTGEEQDEFSQIIFPTAKALALNKIYGFDNRDDEYAYFQALRNNDKEMRNYVMEKFNTQDEEAIRNKLDSILGVNERKIRNQSKVFEFLNSTTYDTYREMEYTQRLALTPTENSRKLLYFWELRNQKMSNNVEEVLEKTQADKAVIVIGAVHTWILRKFLEEKGYEVKRMFEL